METYTRMTVQGVVAGRHAALVDAAAAALDSMVPADVANLIDARRQRVARLDELVAAVTRAYDVVPA
ncbi:MAG: hypothetical protein JO079_06905 [Frankiaceae bacterium]|nr:hypothetical protein [Frankiaceae bacterium]